MPVNLSISKNMQLELRERLFEVEELRKKGVLDIPAGEASAQLRKMLAEKAMNVQS
jgi:hypothetical protein